MFWQVKWLKIKKNPAAQSSRNATKKRSEGEKRHQMHIFSLESRIYQRETSYFNSTCTISNQQMIVLNQAASHKRLHTVQTQYRFLHPFFFFGWGGGEGQVQGLVGESQMRSWSYKLFLSCSIIQKMNIMLPLCDAQWSTNAPIFILFLLIHCIAGNLYSALLTSTRNQPAASPPIYGHCPAPLESLYLFASPPWLHNKTYDFHHALFLATKPW